MEEAKDDQPGAIINIATDGDVILIVGPEKLKFRVHSLFLKEASKPFFAMFGPDWKEGNDILDRDGPVELPLPEDNAAALQIIFTVIHHRNNKVPQTLIPSDILAVAVTADKYDFVDAMKFASGNWLRVGKSKAGDLVILAAAALLFQNARAFKEITKELVLIHDGPFLDLVSEEVESAINWRVFCK